MTPLDIVTSIAASDLADRDPLRIDAEHNDAVIALLREHRIEGVAVEMVTAGTLDVDDEFSAELVRRHDETMAQTLRVEIASVRTSELLADHGIPHRLLKGAALAHTVARAPAQRSFRDVDILVPSTSIDDAVAMFEFDGATRMQPQLRDGFDARFGKSVTLAIDGVEVDVHRVLAAGPFGVWMRPNDLFLLGSTVSIAGLDVPTLDTTEHLVHACYHAALGSPEPVLVNLRDIALLASHAWDGERFEQTITRWRGTAVVQRAVRLVEDQLGIDLPEELRSYRHMSVDSTERAAVDPYLTNDPRGRFAALVPATFKALPASQRVAFARAVGLPDGTTPRDRVRSLLDRVR